MTETEADILDELYFITPFKSLIQELDLDEDKLFLHLQILVEKGFVKCFYPDPDTEVAFKPAAFAENFESYFFLATKAGLLAHNSR